MPERPEIYCSNKGRFHVRRFLNDLINYYRDQRLQSVWADRENNHDKSHWWYEKHTFLIEELDYYLTMLDKA